MKRAIDKAIRISVIVTTIVAWLSISNHCALGGLIVAGTQPGMAPMHCHGNQPTPAKKSSEDEMPCCKMLRAIVPSDAKVVEVAQKDFVPVERWILVELILAETRVPALELDTGPPFSSSFAESVLQRSILAHAPPFLA